MEKKIEFEKLIEIERNRKKYERDFDLVLSDVSCLEGISFNDLKNLKIEDTQRIIKKYGFFYDVVNNIKPKNELTIDGKKYNICDVSELTFGQFMDYEEILKAETQTEYEKLPQILAILLNDEKDYVKYKKRFIYLKDKIKKCDYEDVLSCGSFFLANEENRLKNTPLYLAKQKEMLEIKMELAKRVTSIQMREIKSGSRGFMGGIKRFLIWLITIYLKQKKLQF